MGFNIEAFKANGLIEHAARPTQFKVRMNNLPTGVGQGTSQQQFEYLCSSGALPAFEIGKVEVAYFGRRIPIMGDRVFQDWSVSVYNDESFNVRSMFENWSNQINSLVSNRQNPAIGDIGNYKAEATVYQLGKQGPGDDSGVIRAYKFVGIFPIMVGEIGLSWEASNTIEQFEVRFAYDYFVPEVFGGGEQYAAELASG